MSFLKRSYLDTCQESINILMLSDTVLYLGRAKKILKKRVSQYSQNRYKSSLRFDDGKKLLSATEYNSYESQNLEALITRNNYLSEFTSKIDSTFFLGTEKHYSVF